MRLPSEVEPVEPTEYQGRTFDVLPSRDDRNLDYPVRAIMAEYVEPQRRAWRRGAVLDQGREGACVGFAWTQELISTPFRVKFDDLAMPQGAPSDRHPQQVAPWVYRAAQRIDEWPGEAYEGTSVLAGAKIAQSLGLIHGYRWAFSAQDMRDAVITQGPVVIGIPWYSGMYSAPGGELRVSGSMVGWHAILVNAYDPRLSLNGQGPRAMYRLTNSWGTDWGRYGSAWMDADALWALIEGAGGDVCVPVGRALGSAA